jgi:phenylalanyl-tRNA synthetase beta chain
MKISYQWLKEIVDIEVSARQLADDLTMAGVAVETIETVGADHILDLDLTTNRPDCLSHWGVAREVAVLYGVPTKSVRRRFAESATPADSEISIKIAAPSLCSRYSARVVFGVKVAPSPRWLADRLEALGVRSINNVADATNYILMELGHPLHAFDLVKLEGRQIIVRESEEFEILTTIDGVERRLSKGMLVIADQSRPVALAGVMGGLESEIGFSTRDVLIESAWFEPVSIRKTSKILGMHTEASHRFERGADISATLSSLDQTAALVQELAGGEISRGVVDVFPRPLLRSPVRLRSSRIRQVMGIEIPAGRVEEILTRLGFQIADSNAGGWIVNLPSFRLDVEREIDLIEEVARHLGYDQFPSTLPGWKGEARRRPNYLQENALQERLYHLGYSETFTYSFVGREETLRFSSVEPVSLLNPLSSEMEVMRTSLLPGLLASLTRNYNRGLRNVRLCEMGRIFHPGDKVPLEKMMLGLLISGTQGERSVHAAPKALDFYDLKGDVEILWESFALASGDLSFGRPEPDSYPYYHPGILSEIRQNGTPVGVFGQLHPRVCDSYKVRQAVFVAELFLENWYGLKPAETVFAEIPKFPPVQRDLSIVINKELDYSKIESTVREAQIPELRKVFPFDLYSGDQLPDGKKAVAVTVVYQSSERTLAEDEIKCFQDRIVTLLREKLNAQLRS